MKLSPEELTQARVVCSLRDNLTLLRNALRTPRNKDCIVREFSIGDTAAALVFTDGLASRDVLQFHLLEPCMQWGLSRKTTSDEDLLEILKGQIISIQDLRETQDMDEGINAVLSGLGVLFVDGHDRALLAEARGFLRRPVSTPINENVVYGSQEGFVEHLRTNVSLMRSLVRTPRLVTEMLTVGTQIQTNCAMLYLDGIADGKIVAEVARRLDGVNIDFVGGVGQLQQLIEDHPMSIIPQICSTERPDRAASFLRDGQVLVFLDGSPQTLAMPVTLDHLYHASDDTYMRWQYGTFLRFIRQLGMLLSLYLPSVFIALIQHHQEMLPAVLISSMYEARARLPLPVFAEVLVMILAFHLVNEASLRVPGPLGSSMGVLSALILGQAAVAANLVSQIPIIVVAIAGLGGFVISDYELSLGIKIRQLLYLIIGNYLGLYGLFLFSFFARVRSASLHSFGVPLRATHNTPRPHNIDSLLRFPIWMQRRRPFFAAPSAQTAVQDRARVWDKEEEEGGTS